MAPSAAMPSGATFPWQCLKLAATVTGSQGIKAAVSTSDRPSSSRPNRASSLAPERGKGVVVDDYEFDSNLDPDDVRMFEEGFTHTVGYLLKISYKKGSTQNTGCNTSELNLLRDTKGLVPQFGLLCSAAECEALRDVSEIELMHEVAAMGLRSYMLEIESARRANTRAKIFLMILEKYRCYRNKCREMHERLRASAGNQSLGEELEKRDQELMQSICRNSELEELLCVKDEELVLGKRVTAECEHLQAKLLSLQSELDQNAIRVEALGAEWMGKLAELERKVSELESAESAWASASSRVAALEITIRVLQSEQESERETATLREARLEERIGKIDQEASNLGDWVAVLEAEKAQLLAQVESASTICSSPFARVLGSCRGPTGHIQEFVGGEQYF
uniref:Uncharacterized protein LOC104218108 n=1 Tax=Nicotiana sylvestris TaxID=4096 RepID=A0A1U7VXU0_NICSY|nr:PREDICTED: uncharacterized protein LOC104218108 [Nicotiana sylvestris]